MCVVSQIMDYGKQTWPGMTPGQPWFDPFKPALDPSLHPLVYPTIPTKLPSAEEIAEFYRLFEAAKRFDALTGQIDCEDPEKMKFMEAMEKRLAVLEEERLEALAPKPPVTVLEEPLSNGSRAIARFILLLLEGGWSDELANEDNFRIIDPDANFLQARELAQRCYDTLWTDD